MSDTALVRQNPRPGTDEPKDLVLPADKHAELMAMVDTVPGPDGDGMTNIVLSIMGATSYDELDKPWDTTSSDTMLGVVHEITGMTKLPSRYRGGIGCFFVIRGRDDRGRDLVWTTSAVAVLVQLAMASAQGWVPGLIARLDQTEETANGHHAYYLTILGRKEPIEAQAV